MHKNRHCPHSRDLLPPSLTERIANQVRTGVLTPMYPLSRGCYRKAIHGIEGTGTRMPATLSLPEAQDSEKIP